MNEDLWKYIGDKYPHMLIDQRWRIYREALYGAVYYAEKEAKRINDRRDADHQPSD